MEFTISGSVDDERIFDNFATKWLVADLVTPRNRVPSIAQVFHAYTLTGASSIVDPSSCNNLPVARALSSEPSRIAGPFYRISARHLFSVIGHITASAFARLRISALLVQILALFPRADMGQIVEPTGTYRSYSSSGVRSEEHTSELQSLMRISYDVFCLKKKKNN